ncbi:MAG: ArsR family transcriptional regulator [Chloroflexi bacterium CFX4]|nr:ArsR family transcriptional regulator [Chloroflexi bacterium CFX4]MDL1923413.1 ArsR family transcriptional regulator [Chloroflexi bacterium CFX3]
MQQTRQHILEILRERTEATVDELVNALHTRIQHNITAVTVRHHLDILRGEDLVTAPKVRRSGAPGRPQYVYALTDKAREQFPNNYHRLMQHLFQQLKARLDASQVNVILEGVADQMVAEANLPAASLNAIPMAVRLDHVVEYLNTHGYEASWETNSEGYILRTHNCPYHQLAGEHGELCGMDMRLISGLLGVVPRNMGRLAEDSESCAYLIPVPQPTTQY